MLHGKKSPEMRFVVKIEYNYREAEVHTKKKKKYLL